MGKKVKKPKVAGCAGGELRIELFAPGMTAFHKVGLAGLWMTLKALEDENEGKASLAGGSWARDSTRVTLRWNDDGDEFFKALFEKSFRLDTNSLIWLPALGPPADNMEHAVVLQEAILGSLLQHGRTRRSDKAAEPKGIVAVEIDGAPLVLKFHRLTEYAHQKADYSPARMSPLAGWLLPGGAVRHVGLGQGSTALEDPPGPALALRFAPVGAVFFELRCRGTGVRPRYALVIPEVADLQRYAAARQCFLRYGVQQLYAAGSADAGFRVLAELESANLLDDVAAASCRVASFGTVPWSAQQKSRMHLATVRAGSGRALQTFKLCRQLFAPRLVKPRKGQPFWDVPQAPDLIAQNLSEGKHWWQGFAQFVADADRRDHVFAYEKEGLAMMVQDTKAFPEGAERTFVAACHEAWRRRMAQIGEKSKRQGSSFRDEVRREFEKLRVTFARCKNLASLREAITDFWARGGGPLKALQHEGWQGVMTLLNERDWRKAKDLVLLALASYRPQTKSEAEVLEATGTPEQGEGEQE
jgi:CRISPR-associated protein Cas8a1/Csx13